MLPLKLVRFLVRGETINNIPFSLTQTNHNHHTNTDHENDTDNTNIHQTRTPLLLFLPTKELVTDTYRLATLARDIGMDLYPNPSLSHIIFSWPSSSPSPCSTTYPSLLWSSTSLSSSSSSSWSLPNDAVPLPFPSLSTVSLSSLRLFVSLSKSFFKVVFLSTNLNNPFERIGQQTTSNWDCCSVSLISRLTHKRIDSMDEFSKVLAGMGWTLFKTNNKTPPSWDCVSGGGRPIWNTAKIVYLFRKLDSNRVCARQPNGIGNGGSSSGECRIRELRLAPLDFRNAPLRILQYILLMTDDIFYLA